MTSVHGGDTRSLPPPPMRLVPPLACTWAQDGQLSLVACHRGHCAWTSTAACGEWPCWAAWAGWVSSAACNGPQAGGAVCDVRVSVFILDDVLGKDLVMTVNLPKDLVDHALKRHHLTICPQTIQSATCATVLVAAAPPLVGKYPPARALARQDLRAPRSASCIAAAGCDWTWAGISVVT
eukprot:scaffold20962_cov112-Isochrysis_galbana.AAC.9